ncbi:MAG: thiol protease/hemagglutinin PrtT [Fibromonadales bacterium]|nr:thiol protease/hemagglutinin PrtT [Fibromonadales bacterium]
MKICFLKRAIAIFYFFVILTFFASSIFAKPISQSEAHNIASNLVKNKKHLVKLKTKKTRNQQERFSNELANPEIDALYYVFETGENGFAIIAGDDIFKPILGFSENGKFDYADMPPNFAWYLQNLEKDIVFALQNGQTADPEIKMEWEKYAANPYVTGTFLIKTTWNQESPYNNICPVISGNRTLTGCIATSMSQIMNYHKWPLNVSGDIPEYNTRNLGISVQTINRQDFSYDWQNMANSYSSTTTTAQKNAVATIMHHAGVAVQMDYKTNASGAFPTDIPKAMSLYFDYDKNIRFIKRDGQYYRPEDYTAIGNSFWRPANDSILPQIWDDIMKIQIDSLLPIIYSGNDGSNGHSFILDGYDNNGRFHFNWGWGGGYDGWFVSSVLNPNAKNYSSDQDAVINIMPNLHGTGNEDLRIFGRNLRTQKTLVARGEVFTVNPTIYNIGTATSPRGKTLGIALFNSEEQFRIIGIAELDSVMTFTRARELTNSSYLRGDFSLDVQSIVPADISPGNYTLKAVIKNELNEWEILKTAKNYLNNATITVNEEIFSDNSNIRLCGGEIKITQMEGSYTILQGKPLEVSISILNNGSNIFIGKINAELGNLLNSNIEKIGESWLAVPTGNICKTVNLYSNSITSDGGEYILSAMAENLSGEKRLIEEYKLGSYIHYKNQIPIYVKGLIHGNLIVNEISAIALENYVFVDSLKATLYNIGQNPLTNLELNFKHGIFASSENIPSTILSGNLYSFKFAPVLGLETGTYKDTLIITGDNGIYLLYPLEFEVTSSTAIKWNFIVAEIPQNAKVWVYNIKGKLIAKSEKLSNTQNFDLPPGIYIVKIKGEKFNISKKIIVMR